MPLDPLGFTEEYLNQLDHTKEETRQFFEPMVQAVYDYRLQAVCLRIIPFSSFSF